MRDSILRCHISVMIWFLATVSVGATTLIVDGPGDGDGANGDEYDTIRDAIVALDALGRDGQPDTIEIVVDALSSANGFVINGTGATLDGFPIFTDPLIVDGDADGNGEPATITVTGIVTVGRDHEFQWRLADGQDVAMRDLIFIPSPTLGPGYSEIEFSIEDAEPTAACTASFERVAWVASNSTGDPVTPEQTEPIDATEIGTLRVTAVSASSALSIALTDCALSHMHRAFTLTGPLTQFTLDGCTLRDFSDLAIMNQDTAGTIITLRETTVAESVGAAIWLADSGPGMPSRFDVLEGCLFADNMGSALIMSSASEETFVEFNFVGTSAQPIVFRGHQGDPVIFRYRNASLTVENLIFYENVGGWTFDSADLDTYPVTFEHCLFADNTFPPLRVTGDVTSSGPVTLTARDCTFHAASSPPASVGALVEVNAIDQSDALTLSFDNCIFTGLSTEAVIDLTPPGGDITVEIFRCAIPSTGPNAIATILRPAGEASIDALFLQVCDPLYVNTDTPPGPDSFDVQEEVYRLGDIGPISGWGDFIGGMEICPSAAAFEAYR